MCKAKLQYVYEYKYKLKMNFMMGQWTDFTEFFLPTIFSNDQWYRQVFLLLFFSKLSLGTYTLL